MYGITVIYRDVQNKGLLHFTRNDKQSNRVTFCRCEESDVADDEAISVIKIKKSM
jgi:hypothetical protein